MAPWNVSWPFGEANSDLPDSIAPSKSGSDSAFEVFIDGALTKIYNEANGRSKDNRAIREACKSVLGELTLAWGYSTMKTDVFECRKAQMHPQKQNFLN